MSEYQYYTFLLCLDQDETYLMLTLVRHLGLWPDAISVGTGPRHNVGEFLGVWL